MNQTDPALDILLLIGGLIIFVIFIRWVFRIPTIVKNAKIQTRLLSLLAEKAGIPKSEIDKDVNATSNSLSDILSRQ